jgi:nitrogen fixation/metabolism regulation signal transduction histidine kinase
MDPLSWIAAGAVLAGSLALLARASYATREARRQLQSAAARGSERQALLAAIVEAAPMAVVLLRGTGKVVLTNPAARELLFQDADGAGQNLMELIGNAPAAFRDAMLAEEDAIFTVGGEGDAETYHLAKRPLALDGDALTLVLVRNLTRELRRREVAVWKKLLRVISHEVNNSLAPISSMAHSAQVIAKAPDKLHLLGDVFTTIEERTRHLQSFLEGYADLARLPAPRRGHVAWTALLHRVGAGWPDVTVADAPSGTGWVDEKQVEQLVQNLLKNAREAGGEKSEICLDVERVASGFEIIVRDRGSGMSEEVLKSALLPFYSTKERGTGLGLALCREIVEAHDGKIRLSNRDGGGLEVACFFPDASASRGVDGPSRLTVTRG